MGITVMLISSYGYFAYLLLIIISFLDFMSRIAVIWISSPELSYVCHTYAMPICAPMRAENSKIRNKDSCILFDLKH